LGVETGLAALRGPALPPSPGAEHITFQSRNLNQKNPVPAVLVRPQGGGPFPAVVLVHPCSGITVTMYQDWTPWFVARGYIVVVPDSLAPWHQTSVCYAGAAKTTATHPDFRDAAFDAWGALKFLRSRMHMYPGVYHEFDVPTAHGTLRVSGTTVHVGFDAAADADAHTRAGNFLDEHLK
jgi:dienelactone hydrolase